MLVALALTAVVAYPSKFGLSNFYNYETVKFMRGQTGTFAILLTEQSGGKRRIECIDFGVIADVPKGAHFSSPCGDKFTSTAKNASTTRYALADRKKAKCAVDTDAETADVLCARMGNKRWYGDVYNAAQSTLDRSQGNITDKNYQVNDDIPNLFLSSAWLLAFGVAAHVLVRVKYLRRAAAYAHYTLMIAAVGVAAAGVAQALGKDASRSFHSEPHANVGRAAFGMMCANAVAGLVHVASNYKYQLVGTLHRINGLAILACVGYLHYTGTEADGPIALYPSLKDADVSFYVWVSVVPLLAAVSFLQYARMFVPEQKPPYSQLQDGWDGTAPNLMNL